MQHKYLIGTLFDEEQLNKKMNSTTTKAKDPMGNVRWKGAFTGGFEAGFKNTCGSKQGWTPSSFVSSVGNRMQKKDQNIFDFMDKQDLGREAIGENISVRSNFKRGQNNPLNIKVAQSMGDKILTKLKKNQAFLNAPEDIGQLHKLLQKYEHEEVLQSQLSSYNLKGIEGYASVGAFENIPDDDFIVAYEDLFRKVIRAGVQEQTQQQAFKRREQNKIYFDFTRPLEQEPEYLKEIHEVDELTKPKKRRRNVINDKNLRDLFKIGSQQLRFSQSEQFKIQDVPAGYDPYHRLKNMKENEKQLALASEKAKHKIYNIKQRSDVLSEGKLSSRFVSASSIATNKFVKSGQEQKVKELEKVFEDEKKNGRYWDYVLELEGKKISAQLQYLSYEEAEKEKQQFDRVYKLKQLAKAKSSQKALPTKIEEALKAKNKKQVKVVRKTGFWKPQRLLCKRFGCMLPYKEEPKARQNNYQ